MPDKERDSIVTYKRYFECTPQKKALHRQALREKLVGGDIDEQFWACDTVVRADITALMHLVLNR